MNSQPLPFFLLDHLLDLVGRILAAAVLHTVRRDHEDRIGRHILFPCILMDIADVLNGRSDRIEKCGTAADEILLIRHLGDLGQLHSVMQCLNDRIEKHCGHVAFAVFFFLLIDHGVKSPDRVALQTTHRSGSVEDKNDLGEIVLCAFKFFAFLFHVVSDFLFHVLFLLNLCRIFASSAAAFSFFFARPHLFLTSPLNRF